jgi:7-cyano-7-deazaguanine synthase
MSDVALVLLSGGQDSATCLYWALERFGTVHALTLHYGQRHAIEIDAAREIGKAAASHLVLDVPSLRTISDSALITPGAAILADGGLADAEAPNGLPTSFVPGRNMVFLALAAAYAVKLGASTIVTGVCQTDYSGYPDCRAEFIEAMARAATLAMPSSSGPIKIATPLMHMTKAETVQLARSLGPACWEALGKSVTCYEGQRPACGACPACGLRAAGFTEADEKDPANA